MNQTVLLHRIQKALQIKNSNEDLGSFLEALILERRGPKPGDATQEPVVVAERLENNDVLKKLRIALNLKEESVTVIFAKGGVVLGKHELASMSRKKGHKHYKACTDEMLMAFLEGLTLSQVP